MSDKDSLHKQIYENMQSLSTEELQRIWLENDRAVWSDAAFGIIEQILKDRTGQVPTQENYEEKLAKTRVAREAEEEDTYYSFSSVEKIGSLADIAAWVVLIGYIADWVLNLYEQFTGLNPANLGVWIMSVSAVGLIRIFSGIYLFVILKAIAQGIYVLVDIEENTHVLARHILADQKGSK